MRKLGIDYGDARVGVAITDELGITAQGLETIHHNGNDKLVLKRLEELFNQYQIDTIVIGVPINMNGTKTERVEVTEKFIHKLKCKFNKIKIEEIDERLTTVAAHKTMNYLGIKKENKKNIVDTISAVYILETFINQQKTLNQYKSEASTYSEQLETAKETNSELQKTKENVNSTEYIEEVAREKLDMYLPNERVYIDISK